MFIKQQNAIQSTIYALLYKVILYKVLLYKVAIIPIWTYGIQVWAKKSNVDMIKKSQNKAFRNIAVMVYQQ